MTRVWRAGAPRIKELLNQFGVAGSRPVIQARYPIARVEQNGDESEDEAVLREAVVLPAPLTGAAFAHS